MNAVDTNILIYVQDPRDPVKQATATALVTNLPDAALMWQVANEYIAASRKLGKFGYNSAQAFRDIGNWRRVWTTILPTWAVMDRAQDIGQRFNLSFVGRNDRCRLLGGRRHVLVFRRFRCVQAD